MLRASLIVIGSLLAISMGAQTPASSIPTVEFHFENLQLQPNRYVITVHPDGTGHFHAEAGQPSAADVDASLPSQDQDRPIQLSPAAAQRIFAVARAKKFFAIACEMSGSHVAFTGRKELSYTGPQGRGDCLYNYSKDEQIQWITAEMQGIAGTLEEGRRLDMRHEHSRLSLDAELESLQIMAHGGQALELANIAPTLEAIVNDTAVLEHAQRRARQLLQIANAANQTSQKK